MNAKEGLAVEIDESEFEIRLLGWSCVHWKCSRTVAYAEVRFERRQIFFFKLPAKMGQMHPCFQGLSFRTITFQHATTFLVNNQLDAEFFFRICLF